MNRYFSVFFIFLFFITQPSSSSALTINDPPQISRTVEKITGTNEYKVTITIKGHGIKGFVKYTDFLPAGAVVSFEPQANYDVKHEGDVIKFIWTVFSKDEETKVSYRISFPGIPGFYYRGELKYVSNNEARVLDLGQPDIHVIQK
ncbi:MAG TPA: hypothetical protein VGO45_00835 [Bacteroidia bacterium]|jgi:hypothetical protein|nr:hypothetical protein [Bacteroidia bacterium]